MLPKGNRPKDNSYTVKSMMKPLGSGYQKIDVSKLLHVILRWICKFYQVQTCQYAWYKPNSGRERIVIAYKNPIYFPITPRLQMLFMSAKTVEDMTWYHSHIMVDGVMVHSINGET